MPRELEPPGGCDSSTDPSFPRPVTGSSTSTSLHHSAWSHLDTTSASVFALKLPEIQYNSTSMGCIPSAVTAGLPAFTMTTQLYCSPIQNIRVTPEVPNHRTGVQTVTWPHQTTALMLTSHGSALRSPAALSLHLFRVVGKEHFFPGL